MKTIVYALALALGVAREANYVFGHYNLEIYLEAKPITSGS